MSTVTFYVNEGASLKAFCLDKELICRSSPSFHEAFNPPSSSPNDGSQEMFLEKVPAAIFQLFADYIASSKIEENTPIPYLFQLAVLTIAFQVEQLEFDTMVLLSRMLEKGPKVMAKHVSWVYYSTMPSDELRKLVAKHFVKASWTLGMELETEEEMWARAKCEPETLMGAHNGMGWYGGKGEE